MIENVTNLIALLSPVLFAVVALASWFQAGFRPKQLISFSNRVTAASLLLVAVCGVLVWKNNLVETSFIGIADLGFSLRLDALSTVMLGMIALLGFIIIKFSVNYLDGEQRQGAFIGRLAATIASVQLLVLSGNLAILLVSWVLTSISLHRLLVFYSGRPIAQLAAKKKFILARIGDACLFIAVAVLYKHFGTGNIEIIFNTIEGGSFNSSVLEIAAVFLASAAMFKSAQFPTHGWLIEVMETPTPVSALLHAGLLNAGPFLLIRMAFVMDATAIAPILLIIIGGLTALFASVAYLTQTSVKTALAYSSIGHMGFSLMVCGFGVYAAALLHLVAHSFYKAHSFLSSGSVIDVVRSSKISKTASAFSPLKVVIGIALALGLYAAFALMLGMNFKEDLPLLIIGSVIVMGLSRLFTAAVSSQFNIQLLTQATLLAIIVTAAFFSLESATHYLIASQIPSVVVPELGKILAMSFVLITFASAIFIQLIAPSLAHKPAYQAWAIHFRNGFYANALFDRVLGALRVHSKEENHIVHDLDIKQVQTEQFELENLTKQVA